MSSENPNLVQIKGHCSKGYHPLKELFVSNFYTGKENNAQLCIYVNDECVVDLYGTAIGDTTYTQDSLQVILCIYFFHCDIKEIMRKVISVSKIIYDR